MVTVRYTKSGVIRYTAYAFTEKGVHHLQIDLFVDIQGRRLDRAGEVWLCSQCWGSFEMGIVLGCGWWLVDCWGYHFFWEGLSEKLGRWTCRSSCSKWWMHSCMIKSQSGENRASERSQVATLWFWRRWDVRRYIYVIYMFVNVDLYTIDILTSEI